MKNLEPGVLLLAVALSSLAGRAAVSVYPDYPDAIPRDTAYAVSVVQGGTRLPVKVYNRTEKSLLAGRTRGGDVNRRFCEFAFDGGPATVEIRVAEDVKSYAVFPSRLRLKHAFKDGVVSVTLERPCNFGIRFNDYDKTILSVFADAPERKDEIPAKGAPGVMYVEGWVDAPGRDGVIVTKDDVKEIYLAPGSVLNARLVVRGRGAFVHGRGMVLDPLSDIFRYDQTKNEKRGLLVVGATDVRVKDVKLVDARTFNFTSWQRNVRFENVKALSAMMCTDGITVGNRGFVCAGAWLYVGDNGLVLSGCQDFVISNAVVGTSCAAIFPQGSPAGRLVDVDVFRADDGLINNWHNGGTRRKVKWSEMTAKLEKKAMALEEIPHQTVDLDFVGLSAVDAVFCPYLFNGRNMGTKAKRFAFTDTSMPAFLRYRQQTAARPLSVGLSEKWLDTSNYAFAFTNLWIGGAHKAAFAADEFGPADRMCVSVVGDGRPSGRVALTADRTEVGWTCPRKAPRPALPPDLNLVREIWPRQSVWQRVPSWLVKMETENGTDPARRVYKLVQCEKGAGMQAIVTDEALALGRGRYRLSFEARVELSDGACPVPLRVLAQSNDWRTEGKVSVGAAWTPCAVELDLPIEAPRDDLVGVSILATRPMDVLRVRAVSLKKVR